MHTFHIQDTWFFYNLMRTIIYAYQTKYAMLMVYKARIEFQFLSISQLNANACNLQWDGMCWVSYMMIPLGTYINVGGMCLF